MKHWEFRKEDVYSLLVIHHSNSNLMSMYPDLLGTVLEVKVAVRDALLARFICSESAKVEFLASYSAVTTFPLESTIIFIRTIPSLLGFSFKRGGFTKLPPFNDAEPKSPVTTP